MIGQRKFIQVLTQDPYHFGISQMLVTPQKNCCISLTRRRCLCAMGLGVNLVTAGSVAADLGTRHHKG